MDLLDLAAELKFHSIAVISSGRQCSLLITAAFLLCDVDRGAVELVGGRFALADKK